MGYFQNNYRCKKCNGNKFYIAFLAKELKITCVGCGDVFYERVTHEEKSKKVKRWDEVGVMVSAKLDEFERNQDELIQRVKKLEEKVNKLESKS
ncbi:MAG: hypothetical protein ACRCWM_05525 [Sarcina sp.]